MKGRQGLSIASATTLSLRPKLDSKRSVNSCVYDGQVTIERHTFPFVLTGAFYVRIEYNWALLI